MFKLKNKKAFTIIELIVVVALLGILVLLGLPRLMGYTAKAQLVRIQHDTKIMQDKMEEVLSKQNVVFNNWDDNAKDLGTLILRKQLYEAEGIAKSIDKSNVKYPKYNWVSIDGKTYASLVGYEDMYGEEIILGDIDDNILGMGGPGVPEEKDGYGYKIIPSEYKNEIKTRLKGTFYSNAQGKVYYEPDRPFRAEKQEIAPSCVAPEILDYEFEYLTGTIVKYNGNSQYLIIPNSFLVDGKCWPVRIIGRGSFSRNMPPPPIKKVVLPTGLQKIEEDAFKDNEIEEIVIPPGVTDIGPGAFAGNNLGTGGGVPNSQGVTIQRPEGSVNIGSGAFGSATPTYKPSTNKDVGVSIKPNKDRNGNVITGSGGRPTGSISGSWGSSGGSNYGNSANNNSGNPIPNGKVIVIPSVIVVDDIEVEITGVNQGAFQGEGLIHVTMPLGLERIEDYAFAGNQLIGVNIPQRVNHVGNYAFGYNELYDGKEYKWTIEYIDFKSEPQLSRVNRSVGSIENAGAKVNILKETNLLDHIWISSAFDFEIPEDYNPLIKMLKTEIPTTPTISNITENSVTVIGGEGVEVKIGNGEWFNSPHSFTNLAEGTDYIAYSRYKETGTHYASEPSEGVDFSTIIIPKAPSNFAYTGNVQTFVVPTTGTYQLEVWGAQGGTAGRQGKGTGGNGGYSRGNIHLNSGDILYVYVGGQNGFNGGGVGYVNGGGASDFRVGAYGLDDRIIIAGGGGGGKETFTQGGTEVGYVGGVGGGLTGGDGVNFYGGGATQTEGGKGYAQTRSNGLYGQGGKGDGSKGSGGGGGYYGGAGGGLLRSDGYHAYGGGGGGSGYISGLTNGIMSSGVHSGNGKAVITHIGK